MLFVDTDDDDDDNDDYGDDGKDEQELEVTEDDDELNEDAIACVMIMYLMSVRMQRQHANYCLTQ